MSPLHSTGARRMPRCKYRRNQHLQAAEEGLRSPAASAGISEGYSHGEQGGSGRSSICLLLGLRMAAAPGQESPAHRAVKGATVTRPKEPMTVWMISRRHILVVQDVVNRGALGHEDHEQGDVAAGRSEEQGGGHGAHGGPAHVEAGAGGLLPAQVGDASPPPRGRRR